MTGDSTATDSAKTRIGHLVLQVKDVHASARFYCDVLGMLRRRSGVFNGERMIFLTFGRHDHDLALLELRTPAGSPEPAAVGLNHVAFCIGERIEELRGFKTRQDRLGISPDQMIEHLYAKSIYLRDPDGIGVEIFVETEIDTPFVESEMEVMNPPLHLD